MGKENYQVFAVGKDDNKIHKILNKRERMIFNNKDKQLHLISHSIFSCNKEPHIVLQFNEGYIELHIGDDIIIDNLNFYIISNAADGNSSVNEFKFIREVVGLVSYNSKLFGQPLK
jgi:hypothetical protein